MSESERSLHFDELKEYVEAFKSSSDRARYAFYFVVVATVLMGIANYNLQNYGWPLLRMNFMYEMLSELESEGQQEPERARLLREEYHKQFVANAVAMESPMPGVWIDANDLGLLGGIALALLMAMLMFCVAREHENLYLALFRVRDLCQVKGHEKGNSEANLLYHALAMRQAISFPPTLARWRKRIIFINLGFIYLIPSLVYCWVVWTNSEQVKQSPQMAEAFRVDLTRQLFFQYLLAALILYFGVRSSLLSRSMARRWSSVFYRVNPHRRCAPQMTTREWLGLFVGRKKNLSEGVIKEVVDTLSLDDPQVSIQMIRIPAQRVAVKGTGIRTSDRNKMAQLLLNQGETSAAEWCSRNSSWCAGLIYFQPTKNTFLRGVWTVAGRWKVRIVAENERSFRPFPPKEGLRRRWFKSVLGAPLRLLKARKENNKREEVEKRDQYRGYVIEVEDQWHRGDLFWLTVQGGMTTTSGRVVPAGKVIVKLSREAQRNVGVPPQCTIVEVQGRLLNNTVRNQLEIWPTSSGDMKVAV